MASAQRITASEAAARLHLERSADWEYVHLNGIRYVVMESGRSKRVYWVRADGNGCECEGYQRWGYAVCSHMLAVRLSTHPAIREVRGRYEHLFPPTCQAKGCTDDAERDEMFCTRHVLADAF